ncbi:hypothetical protein I553_3862 [Mycobacterium xenopi 4042]|uniref:Uncharacterized protein n=1 Tax=Mycobacterium xenopi 4042 TaxID=1299334 RepID=X8APK7_MYCXE|nr:hypothetical protein I553_3548 [Mycobacterium xenopi 4042]EUA33081.1 hypothetical protein I553_3862 [Mycobacterium xenopi 4042]
MNPERKSPVNFINQVLMNIVSQGRWTAIAVVCLAALGCACWCM